MRANKKTSYSNTYSYNHNSKMKCKRVGKRDVNTDNTPMCYQKPKNSAKNLFAAFQVEIDPLDNQLGYKGE